MRFVGNPETSRLSFIQIMVFVVTLTALSIWNLAEVQIGIIAACGPTLRQIIGHIMPSAQSLQNLLSGRGNTDPPSKVSDGNGSFSKMADSTEQLHLPGHVANLSTLPKNGGVHSYEMDMRNGSPVVEHQNA